jgi:hypothetical protein
MKLSLTFKICCIALLMSSLWGCATKPVEVPTVSIEQYLKDADSAVVAGQTDRALVLLDKASSSHPTRKEPWARGAQINFDAGNYGPAIVKAQEALQRDPSDLQSNSILAVSGLRVSTKALSDLRQGQALKGGVRTDAESLAKVLRETLGENVLVPVTGVPQGSSVVEVVPQPRPVVKPRSAAPKTAKPATKPADGSDGGSADPFSALRK